MGKKPRTRNLKKNNKQKRSQAAKHPDLRFNSVFLYFFYEIFSLKLNHKNEIKTYN